MTRYAATLWNNGKCYLFKDDQYYRYDVAADRVDDGFPKSISAGWPGLWSGDRVDAGVVWNNGKAYLFRDDEYVRWDVSTDQADSGFPKKIADSWPGVWTDRIDAVVSWNNGKAYFFRGEEYLRYDVATDSVDSGFPKKIADDWPGVWSDGVDSAVLWNDGTAYFFKAAQYLSYDVTNDQTRSGFPKDIAGNWPGLEGTPLPSTPAAPPAPAGKVTSSNIQVAGKHFIDWLNDDFLPTQTGNHPTITIGGRAVPRYPAKVNKANFITAFDACEQLYAKELTVPQFLCLFCIIDNETGGSFLPISEVGGPKYMFESAGKKSYNQPPNRPAGGLLRDRNFISSDDDVAAWNSTTTYPDPQDDTLKAAALECDFYKFRGRGLIQLTWRSAYLSIVDPLLTANGHPKSDDLAEAALTAAIRTDANVYLPMVKSTFRRLATQFAAVDNDPPDWRSTGTAVAGVASYGDLLQFRCETLLAAMTAAGFTCS